MRIVSLVPSCTETLFYLGLAEQLVGITDNCDFPPETGNRAKVGYFSSPYTEKIIALKPDLVIAGGKIHHNCIESLTKSGVNVFNFELSSSLNALLSGMEEISRIINNEADNRNLDFLREKKRNIESLNAGSYKPRVAFLIIAGGKTVVSGLSYYQYNALELCGARPMATPGDGYFTLVTWEDIVFFDPEIILTCGRYPDEEPRKICPGCMVNDRPCMRDITIIKNNPHLADISANRSDHVYPVPCHFFCRPGPRLFDGMQWLSNLIRKTNSLEKN